MAELSGLEIAVIGMAGRFPGGIDTIDGYWSLIREGRPATRSLSDEELARAGVPRDTYERPDYVRVRGYLTDADCFDAALFGLTPRDAAILDPQHRVFLECAWHALEDAGYAAEPEGQLFGIYASASLSTYLIRHLLPNSAVMASTGSHELLLGNDKDSLASRVSYLMNLRGPAVAVQSACSSSLVAVHTAAQALLNLDCDVALAGGVSIRLPQDEGYHFEEGGILSPDGGCRSYDVSAAGTVDGNGAGVVVLKRLADALRDGDSVHAVVLGSAVNNDGAARVGFTAPSVEGQTAVIAAAHQAAGVAPETIGYVEGHGTATPMGDPIEVAALTRAFAVGFDAGHRCGLGSVKPLIGHLDAAAGIAGFIKAVLCVREGIVPANPYFTKPNPETGLEDSPFFVNSTETAWPVPAAPRRAGVSSFGMGGTNAHIVLEQGPPIRPGGGDGPALLHLSGRTPQALAASRERLRTYLSAHPEKDLTDVAFTLTVGRRSMVHRAVVEFTTRDQAIERLGTTAGAYTAVARPHRDVVMMFPGQGAQRAGVVRGLYADEPFFRERMDHYAAVIADRMDVDLRALLVGPGGAEADQVLAQTRHAQPALFMVELALVDLWRSWGVRPAAMIGHSVGEYVAACVAGVLTPEDALALVCGRGRLMQQMEPGAMLAVALPADEVLPLLDGAVEVAAENAPRQCVLSGRADDVDRLAEQLAKRGVAVNRLRTSHAFHSAAMDPILEEFAALASSVTLRRPELPFVSNLAGDWITDAQATDPRYWATHLRRPVRYSAGLRTLLARNDQLLLEVGPGEALANLARQHDLSAGGHRVLSTLRSGDDRTAAHGCASRLWAEGVDVIRADTRSSGGRRVSLPGYPFARARHWIDPPASPVEVPGGAKPPHPVPPVERPPSQLDSAATGSAADWTSTMTRVAAIWGELMGVPRVGAADDFFALGGHSLLATRIVARIRENFGVALSANALFDHPTVAQLAAEIDRAAGGSMEPDTEALLAQVANLSPDELDAELERLRAMDENPPA